MVIEALKKPVPVPRQVVFTLPYPTESVRFLQFTVPVTPTALLRYNDKRIDLLIFNTGIAAIFINKTQDVSAARGFPIPGGAALTMSNYIGEIWAIAAAPVLVGIIETEAK